MKYKTCGFNTIYDLRDFLNDNKIKPANIVGIYREHKYQDRGYFDLLYVEQVETFQMRYIKCDVLDEIRSELHATAEKHEDGDYYLRDSWIDDIFDKYAAEFEPQESEEA